MNWPNDADGDTFRRLQRAGFDLRKTYSIDFNVDFDSWPPPKEAVEILKAKFPKLKLLDPDEEAIKEGRNGYILFQIEDKLTYDLVIRIQEDVTNLVKKYGGVCESWGVLHEKIA